jgi:hypothetical protein
LEKEQKQRTYPYRDGASDCWVYKEDEEEGFVALIVFVMIIIGMLVFVFLSIYYQTPPPPKVQRCPHTASECPCDSKTGKAKAACLRNEVPHCE